MGPKVDSRHLDARIGALAEAQHGVVGHAQLRQLGLGEDGIRKRVQRGRLRRVRRGVYAVGGVPLGAYGRWLAAVLSCGPRAVLSHRSAAALWGLRPSSSPIVDVSVPSTTGRARREGLRLHRVSRIAATEVTVQAAIPVTTPARTTFDLAAVLPVRGLELVLERSEQLRLFDLDAVERTLSSNAGRPGCAALRATLSEARLGETLTRSKLEEAMFGLCRRSGLPQPDVNVPIGPYVADFLWPPQRLIVETDGFGTHGTRAAFESDRVKDADLMLRGYRVVRFTYRRVLGHPAIIAATLGRLLKSTA